MLELKSLVVMAVALVLATPLYAAGEKPPTNSTGGKGYHCRKLAYEKYHVQDGRALNKAVGAAIQRCKQNGPSAL